MNISKYIAFAAVAAAALTVSAAGPEIQYWTTKNDTTDTMDHYADGRLVANGEWYALGWAADGVFEGVTADYKPMGAGDEILKLVKSYRATDTDLYVVFALEAAEAKKTGQYFVIMLDTRDKFGNPAPETSTDSGVPTRNALAAMASASYVAIPAGVFGKAGDQTGVASADWASTATPDTTAKITRFEVNGDTVYITVEDMSKGVRYNVQSGDAPSTVSEYEIAKPEQATSETKTIELKVKKGTFSKFFKLAPEPMARPNAE